MRLSSSPFAFLIPGLLPLLTHALPSTPNPRAVDLNLPANLPVTVIHEFPLGFWIENLAVRRHNAVLATVAAPLPQLYHVHTHNLSAPPILVKQFPDATSLTGIAELGDGVFYVAVGNFSFSNFSFPGSWAIWKVDFSGTEDPSQAVAGKVADLPEAKFLNGITVLNHDAGILLISDSVTGGVWTLNVNTGAKALTIVDPSMLGVPLGINGIKVRDGALYYTNTGATSFNKIPINLTDGTATGPAVLLLASGVDGDDFTFDTDGNAWVADNLLNELAVLPGAAATSSSAGNLTAVIVAGATNSSDLKSVTAAEFSRSKNGTGMGHLLYLTTGGGTNAQYIYKNFTMGGTVSRVDVSSVEKSSSFTVNTVELPS